MLFTLRTQKSDAYRLYLGLAAATALFSSFVFSANTIWQVTVVGLTPLQLVLVGTVLEVSIFCCEVPTGVVADVYSRRLSLIIGYVLMGLGFCLEGLVPRFEAILLAQALWGVGWTFTSGALEAWITDEVGLERAGKAFVRSAQIGNIVGIGGALVASLLGSVLLNLPIVLGGLLYIALAAFLAIRMPERGFKPAPRADRSTWGQMAHTLRGGARVVRGSTILLAIMGIGLFVGLYSEGFDRLNAAHLLSFPLPTVFGVQLQPILWLNLLGIVGALIGTGALHLLHRRLPSSDDRAMARASLVINVGLLAGLAGFALAGSFAVAVLFRWVVSIARTVGEPVETAWLNRQIDSEVRATVISMRGQMDAFGQMAGGPPVGLVGERLGIRAALIASALILSPVVPLYRVLLGRLRPAAESPAAGTG